MIVRLARSVGSLPQEVEALCVTLGGFQHHWLEILDMVLCGVHLKIIKTPQVVAEFREETNFEVGIRDFGRDPGKLLLSPSSWADLPIIMSTIDYETRWTAVNENGIEDLVRPYSVVGTAATVGARWCRLIHLWSVVPACAAGLLHSGLSLQPEQVVSVDDDTESEEGDQAADGAVQIGEIPLVHLSDSQASLDRAAALLRSPPGSITTDFVSQEVVHSAKKYSDLTHLDCTWDIEVDPRVSDEPRVCWHGPAELSGGLGGPCQQMIGPRIVSDTCEHCLGDSFLKYVIARGSCYDLWVSALLNASPGQSGALLIRSFAVKELIRAHPDSPLYLAAWLSRGMQLSGQVLPFYDVFDTHQMLHRWSRAIKRQ